MYHNDKILLGTAAGQTLLAEDESHLMTIGYTGSGKGVSALVPNLLNYHGSVVCIDIKGEAARLTAGYRQSIGQQVWVVDPFNASGLKANAAINPFAAMSLQHQSVAIDYARALARALLPENNGKDPFWDERARQMLTSLILYAQYRQHTGLAAIDDVRFLLNQMARSPEAVYREVSQCKVAEVARTASALDAEPRVLRSIVSTAQSAMDNLVSREVMNSLASTRAIDLKQVVEGQQFTLYLVIPPHLLSSSSTLLRLWLVTLFQAVYSRTEVPPLETLFLIDEAAQLGPLEELRQAITLMRGYGVRTWTFWQDLSQLKRLYPLDWQSLVNNSLALQIFGAHTGMAQQQLLEVLGSFTARELRELQRHEQLLLLRGKPSVAEKLSYLSCPLLLRRSQQDWLSGRKETLRLVDV